MRKLRGLVGVLVMALLLLNLVEAITVQAAQLSSTKSTYVTSAEDKMVQLSTESVSGMSQKSELQALEIIVEYTAYYHFLYTNKGAQSLNVPNKELKVYAKKLHSMYKDFNSSFSMDSKNFKYLQLNKGSTKYDYDALNSYISESFVSDITSFYTEYLNDLAGNSTEKLAASYQVDIVSLSETLDSILNAVQAISNWTSNNAMVESCSSAISQLITTLKTNEAYESIFQVANTVQSKKSDDEIVVDTSLAYIENMTDAKVDNGTLQIAESPKLSLAYLAIVSASAVYTPFVSHTGCTEFTQALTSLSDADVSSDVLLLYNEVKGNKKPLYKRELDSVGNPTGPATVITLTDFNDDILSGRTGSLCTILGELQNDNSDWVYMQDGTDIKSKDSSVILNFNGESKSIDMQDYGTGLNLNLIVDGTSHGSNKDDNSGEGSSVPSVFNSNDDDEVLNTDPNSIENSSNTTGSKVSSAVWIFDKLRESFQVQAKVTDGFSKTTTNMGSTGGNAIYAHDTITDENVLSSPVVLYGAEYSRAVDNMTTALMNNVLKTEQWVLNIKDADTMYLYVNAFGDIVLEDDTVVIPAAANPLYYSGTAYNPFTVAFMNSYPSILKNTGQFKLASKSDVGKYVVFGVVDGDGTYSSFVAAKATSISEIETQGPLTIPKMKSVFTSNFGEDSVTVFKTRRLIFGKDASAWKNSKSTYYSYSPYLINTTITVDGISIFPYSSSSDTSKIIAKAIVNNMFAYYGVDTSTYSLKNVGNLNDAYMVDAVILAGLNGTNNSTGYHNDMLLKYDTYTANTATRKYKSLLSFSQTLFSKISDLSGVIGVKSIYDNPVVGKVLNEISNNLIFFFFIVVIVMLFYFSKVRIDLFQCAIFTLAFGVFSYLYVSVLPSLLPAAFNFFTNNVAQTISYEILGVDAERYITSKTNGENLNDDGTMNLTSTSFTLYKVQGRDRKSFASSLGVDQDQLIGGNIESINSAAGVYAKNDEICVNTNVLFDTLKITGKVDADYSYKLSSVKTVSNNIDYYVPFYNIVDGLLGKVNAISEIYNIPRKTSVYANGELKDNYLLYSYVNSKPFVTPGEYGFVAPVSDDDWTTEEINAFMSEGNTISEKLTEQFGRNIDWLGLSTWIYSPTAAMKKTLWAQTLQDLGYYDEYWNPNTEHMDELVSYVNYQTKKFVYDISDEIGTLSDDVMIKVVSLRALIALTQRASDFSHWMYPYTINYEEMELQNVLCSVFVNDYVQYIGTDMDIIQYMLEKHGWFNLIVFDVMSLLLSLLVATLNWVIPLCYLALLCVILLRMLGGKGFKEPIKGYLKVSFILIMCSFVLLLAILAVQMMKGSSIAIYFLLLVTLLELYVLSNLVLSVVRDFSEFGNSEINVSIAKTMSTAKNSIGSHLGGKTVKTNNLLYNKKGKVVESDRRYRDDYSRYNLGRTVDEYYDDARYHTVYNSNTADDSSDEQENSEVEDLLDIQHTITDENEVNEL